VDRLLAVAGVVSISLVAALFLAAPEDPGIYHALGSETRAASSVVSALVAGPTETAPGPLPSITAVALLAVVLLGAVSCGRALRRRIDDRPMDPALALALDAGLGLGALAYLVLLLGLIGALYVPVLVGAVLVALAVGRRESRTLVELFRTAALPSERRARLLCIIAVLFGLAALVRNLFPPTVGEWDSLVYHLTGPKLFLHAHRIYFVEHDHHMSFPFTVEMLYTLGLGLHSWRLAKLFHWAMYVFGGLALLGAVREAAGRETDEGTTHRAAIGGWAACLSYLAVPVVSWEASTAYIDLGLALYTLLAVVMVGRWMRGRDRGPLILAGLTAGLAFGVKMTGIVAVGVVGIVALLRGVRDRAPRQAVTNACIAGGIALAVACPWYVRTAVHTGNPVFPFFYEVLDGKGWTQDRADQYKAEQQSHGVHQVARELATGPFAERRCLVSRGVYALLRSGDPPTSAGIVLAPFLQILAPDSFWEHPTTWSIIGPVFLALLPLLALRRPLAPEVRVAVVYVAVGLVAWVFLSQLSRYLIPVLACGALGVGWVLRPSRDAACIVGWGLLSVCLGVFLMLTTCRALVSLPGALGLWSEADVSAQTFESHAAFEYLNRHAVKGMRVALYGEPRAFGLDVPYFLADRGHNTLLPYESMRSADDLLEALRQQGATHVLVNPRYHPGVLTAAPTDAISRMLTDLVHSGRLVRVHGTPPSETMVFAIAREAATSG